MYREYGQHRASAPAAATQRSVEPGRSTRSAALHEAEPTNASAPVQRKEGDGGAERTPKGAERPPKGAEIQQVAATGVSGPASALPFQAQIQRSFGSHDVSGIQAHIGGPAAQACQQLGARAFAMGNHVAFRAAPDLHTAAHEAAHVVQQRSGVQVTGGVGEAGDTYEQNADAAADAVVAGASAEALLSRTPQAQPADGAGAPGKPAAAVGGPTRPPTERAAGAVQSKADKPSGAAPCMTCQGDACECAGPAKSGAGAPAAPAVVQRSIDHAHAPVQKQDGDPADGGAAGWTPPPGCPTDFCQPFSNQFLAQLDKELKWPILRLGIIAKVGVKAAALWELWAMGGTGLLNLSSGFGADFTGSPTTASWSTYLKTEISNAVAARPPVPAGQTQSVSVHDLLTGVVDTNHLPMDFNVIADLAGNVAGGIGADQAANPIGRTPSPQNDDRSITGNVVIQGEANGAQRVTPGLTFTVQDTVDLCPGNCGASSEQIATVPMSQWEASGIAGDVPYTVSFAPPAGTLDAFTVSSTAAPTPTAPKAAPSDGGKTGKQAPSEGTKSG